MTRNLILGGIRTELRSVEYSDKDNSIRLKITAKNHNYLELKTPYSNTKDAKLLSDIWLQIQNVLKTPYPFVDLNIFALSINGFNGDKTNNLTVTATSPVPRNRPLDIPIFTLHEDGLSTVVLVSQQYQITGSIRGRIVTLKLVDNFNVVSESKLNLSKTIPEDRLNSFKQRITENAVNSLHSRLNTPHSPVCASWNNIVVQSMHSFYPELVTDFKITR